jgi:hypothetical protein
LFLGAPAGPFAANTAVTVVIPLNRHSVSLPVLQELRALTLPLSNR